MERLDTIMGRVLEGAAVFANPANEPCRVLAFVAEGDRILWRHNRRWLSIQEARGLIPQVSDLAITSKAPFDRIHENQMLDLVRAIRDAERHNEPPPASMARAA